MVAQSSLTHRGLPTLKQPKLTEKRIRFVLQAVVVMPADKVADIDDVLADVRAYGKCEIVDVEVLP